MVGTYSSGLIRQIEVLGRGLLPGGEDWGISDIVQNTGNKVSCHKIRVLRTAFKQIFPDFSGFPRAKFKNSLTFSPVAFGKPRKWLGMCIDNERVKTARV